MPSQIKLAVIPGDGIGPEVVAEALKVLKATGVDVSTTEFPFGASHYLESGTILEDSDIAELAKHDAILLGAVGGDQRDPRLKGGIIERGLLLKLRFALDHHVNLRPTTIFPGVTSPLAEPGAATEVSLNTAYGVERVVRFAFEHAMARPRKKLTLVHKTNVLTYAGGLWQSTVDRVSAEYPDVAVDYLHVDAATIFLVTKPSTFDVIVTDNLFGDILTDLAAAISGGIGLAASGNLNPSGQFPSMFEPVHGSAPDIAGKQLADPTAAILSIALLLSQSGHADAAAKVTAAVEADLSSRGTTARSTAEIGSAIADAVAQN